MKLYIWKWAVIIGVVWAVCLGVIHGQSMREFKSITEDGMGIELDPNQPIIKWTIEPYTIAPPTTEWMGAKPWELNPLLSGAADKEIGFRSDGVVVWRKKVSK